MLLNPGRETAAAPAASGAHGFAWPGMAAMRTVAVLFACGQAWTTRYTLLPDGVAYLDLARAWLRGDWPQALNSYWSPLYAWMLAVALRILPAGPRWELFAGHAVNLAGCLLSFFAAELLLREWAAAQVPPRHPRIVALAMYLTVVWSALHLVGLGFNSADIFVLALTLFLAALLVRVKRQSAAADRSLEFVMLGLALGFGFLAKAACAALAVAVLPLLAIQLGSVRHKGVRIAAATAVLTCLPWVAALSLSKHRFVYSDTGWSNYALVVGGQSLEGYKDSVHPPPSGVPHPVRVHHEDPRVLSYENHVAGTFPVHSDPAWWAAGYPVGVDVARQWMAVRKGMAYTLWLLAGSPALWLLLIAAFAGAHYRAAIRFRGLGFLAVLTLAGTAPYWMIVVHPRYIAGPLALAGFACVAAVWRVDFARSARKAACIGMALALVSTMWLELVSVPFYLAGEAMGLVALPDRANLDLADAMQRRGLQPGDRVAYIGDTLDATWLALTGAQIVAMVPARVYHDEGQLARPVSEDFRSTDRYWQSSSEQQTDVLRAFTEAGATWVLANEVPSGADLFGWTEAGPTHRLRGADSTMQYFRRLK